MPNTKNDNNLADFFEKDENNDDFQDDLELGQEKAIEELDGDDNNGGDDSGDSGDNDSNDDIKNDSEANSEESDKEQEEAQEQSKEESVNISKSKIVLAKKLLSNIKENNNRLIEVFSGMVDSEDEDLISIGQMADDDFSSNENKGEEGKIIEGVFDGENMIGPDGKQYSVPANYASKSKMVEGDILKLTITGKGTFIYKQISPIERTRIVGELERNSDGSFVIIADSRKWRVLTASVTYFKGEQGDEAVALIPKTGESKWAAVENIVKKSELGIRD